MTSHSPRLEYLDRLCAFLPPNEAARVRAEVESMILDRVEDSLETRPGLSQEEAETAALAALGTPEALAEALIEDSVTLSAPLRRAFLRTLWIVFACHLLLAGLLSAVGPAFRFVPHVLGPIPLSPWPLAAVSVLAIFLMDLGAVLLLFWVLRRKGPDPLHRLGPIRWPRRREAVEGLVLVGLFAVLANGLLPDLFAVSEGGGRRTFLAPEFIDLLPWINVPLALLALRHAAALLRPPRATWVMGLDLAASLAGAAWLVKAAAGTLVRFPRGDLGEATASTLDGVVTRVFLLLLLLGALGLVGRAISLVFQLPQSRRVAA